MARMSLICTAAAALFLALPPALSGCSVGLALHGEREPNLAACRVGATRGEIELELGPPTSVTSVEGGGTECTYEYQIGNEPSAGRAALHAGMDVITLGIWELVGTPEALQGQDFQLSVIYGPDGKAENIQVRRM
jgi:hypothetical protein